MLSKNKIVSFALLVLLALNNFSVLAAQKIDIQAVQTENSQTTLQCMSAKISTKNSTVKCLI